MPLGLKVVRRTGTHYDLAELAVKRLRHANLLVKGRTEKDFELSVIAHLHASPSLRKNLITQVGQDEVEKIHQASLFGFKHRPDTTIGLDGTAIEIKVVSGGSDIRTILGQSIAYRMDYRFVVLVLVDVTDDRQVVWLCKNKRSREHGLLAGLAETFNIFSVVGPLSQSRNLAFL
jgi:hypothetical protein